MDQFDDFNVEEPQQPVQPQQPMPQQSMQQQPVSSQQNPYTQVQSPSTNTVNNVSDTAAPITYVQEQKRVPCPKCGQPVIEGSRYCMHCGNLDFNDERNQSVKNAFTRGQKIKAREEKMKKMFESKNKKMYSLDSRGVSRQEKVYTALKKLFSLLILVAIIVAAINYKTILTTFNNLRKDYYLKQVNTIVEEVTKMYDPDKCTGGNKFYFYDASDYFDVHPSLFTFKQFTGYVEIVKENEEYHYYVTVYDTKYGIDHVDSKKITRKSVKVMKEPDIITESFTCE
ncbi:MAG: hypothetical protein IJ193_05390 [Bacilli bacterium]|nr:hypothetical protein [Bacilli bacterium]